MSLWFLLSAVADVYKRGGRAGEISKTLSLAKQASVDLERCTGTSQLANLCRGCGFIPPRNKKAASQTSENFLFWLPSWHLLRAWQFILNLATLDRRHKAPEHVWFPAPNERDRIFHRSGQHPYFLQATAYRTDEPKGAIPAYRTKED
jgi:hypothetical protein